ncbi:unnamed protein product [Musa acuminata var. zebrina]
MGFGVHFGYGFGLVSPPTMGAEEGMITQEGSKNIYRKRKLRGILERIYYVSTWGCGVDDRILATLLLI